MEDFGIFTNEIFPNKSKKHFTSDSETLAPSHKIFGREYFFPARDLSGTAGTLWSEGDKQKNQKILRRKNNLQDNNLAEEIWSTGKKKR
jgi:hypothetical protein